MQPAPNDCPVLLVEDDEGDQMLVRRAFAKARLLNPLHIVGTGEEAIEYLSGDGEFSDRGKHPYPGLVLLDLKLPGRSGFDVLQWVRGEPDISRTPVVVLTTSRESPDVRRAYELHANSYLRKPVNMEGLVEMIKSVGLYWFVVNELPH
jgi:CheY-like chemotaxis protein